MPSSNACARAPSSPRRVDHDAYPPSPAGQRQFPTNGRNDDRGLTWLGSVSTISSTDIGAAIRHTMRYWDRLTRLADDPRVWLDNNRTERAFRGPVVGRRNHFGSKSRRGTKAAAILYSVIETAKANGLDPAAYLIAAVRVAKLTDGDEHLMPWDFEA